MDMAKIAEKGRISCVFFADWYAGFGVYEGTMDPMLKAGHQVAHLDPMPIVSAMAAVIEFVSFAVTASTSYVNPHILARKYSTLDHLTEGRMAWNIVTSWSKASAQELGQDDIVPHDERYVIVNEYIDLVYR
jgi:alkanesulfonate monooxygenase SsuD/methylene tetrahydromethanopterin reductase-like flavin-dependent oxidoreductase (luciferase family)